MLAHKDCLVCHKHFDADNHEIMDLSIPMLPKPVKVTIINGTASEENPVVGTSITVVADKAKDGMRFVGWRDEKGNFISTEETTTFIVTKDVYLEAVYEKIKTDPVETSRPSETTKPTEPVIPEKPGEEEKEPLSTKQIVAISIAGAVSGCSILGLIFYLIMKRIL